MSPEGTISVLIPYGGHDPDRTTALKRVIGHYLDFGWEVCIGVTHTDPWCKAEAIDKALRQATGDLLVIADADCISRTTPASVNAVAAGAPWASPHDRVRRLGADGHTCEKHPAVRGGGIVALHRDTYSAVPLDPRFTGWGHEDLSWALALDCLAGPGQRGEDELVHYWHPPQRRDTRRIGSHHSRMLERRYWQARNNSDAMRTLIEEAKEATWTQPVS